VNGARIKKVILRPGDSIRIGRRRVIGFDGETLDVSLEGAEMTIALK